MTPAQNRETLAAIDPRRNAVVHAAAGTGKTWLLVSRVVRLLLAGVKPSSILAITFTRKAAAEMRLRVGERLLGMCLASDAELRATLEAIGIPPDSEICARARRLYEQLLVAAHPLRATTFHAFCQDLLTRFSFDAGVPPSFEVLEQTLEIEAAALRALDRDLAGSDAELAAAMDRFMRDLSGLDNVSKALRAFLNHRSDWWAYTENQDDPVDFAAQRLQQALQIEPSVNVFDLFAHDNEVRARVQSLVASFAGDPPPRLAQLRDCLEQALAMQTSTDFYRLIRDALYTKGDDPRAFRIPNDFANRLGPAAVETLMRQRDRLADRFEQITDHAKRHATWQRSRDWYVVGARLLRHFQEEKRAAGVLDFADLEWFTYRMLNQSRHAEWVQYRLDQRIDHLLVDEFQDTNPTQWRLLLPLLQEMAAGSSERSRSVFLVGDEKQSIYRFRGADPELFTLARDWLVGHTDADVYDQHASRRSSPAIVRFVNMCFDFPPSDPPNDDRDYALKDFRTHETHRNELWGRAELLPLVMSGPQDAVRHEFRDPLAQPRVTDEDTRREREGEMIADKIRALVGQPVFRRTGVGSLGYGDVMILLRYRTHAAAYEAALRRAGIPYAGTGRGTFLENLEVRDILALLRLLISPWDNVALATVLRSPIFAAGDDDLLALAEGDSGLTWFQRLITGNRETNPIAPLARAARLLSSWRELADRIPVHDLLDRVYFDANVPARYDSAAPTHLRQRVAANLTRLLDLALEADGGRFPSLARFLARLDVLTAEDSESLDGGTEDAGDQVRILTVHAAKGLESPVVFLADAARATRGGERGADALVEWPVDQLRPDAFVLLSRKSDADAYTADLFKRRAHAAFQEESNLLYVALTRAEQFLFVSGCEDGRKRKGPGRAGDVGRGWYGHIERRLAAARVRGDAAKFRAQVQVAADPASGDPINLYGFIAHGSPAPIPAASSRVATAAVSIDPALTRPFDPPPVQRGAVAADDTDEGILPPETDLAALSAAKRRGIAIHRILDRLTTDPVDRERTKRQIWWEFGASMDNERLTECWHVACSVVDAPDLQRFFDPTLYREARNEVAVLYRSGKHQVTGVIDRLIIRDENLILIDYKTHRVDAREIPALVKQYSPQLRLYAEGLGRLWPGKSIEAVLLFSEILRWAAVEI